MICLELDSFPVLNVNGTRSENKPHEDNYEEELPILPHQDVLSRCVTDVVGLIAGFVLKSFKSIKCEQCSEALERTAWLSLLSKEKNSQHGKLSKPSAAVSKVCKESERVFRQMMNLQKLQKRCFLNSMVLKTIRK